MPNPFVGLAFKIAAAVVLPKKSKDEGRAAIRRCGKCGGALRADFVYCPGCGAAAKASLSR